MKKRGGPAGDRAASETRPYLVVMPATANGSLSPVRVAVTCRISIGAPALRALPHVPASPLLMHCFAVSEVTLPLARLNVRSTLWVTLLTATRTVMVLPEFVIGVLLRSVTPFSLIVKHTLPVAGLICSFDDFVICAVAVLPGSVLAVRLDE